MMRLSFFGWVAALTVVLAGSAVAKPEDGKVYGKWVVQCSPALADAASRCMVTQTLLVTETKARLITLQLLPSPKGELVAAAILPLGIDLPAGVSIQFEKGGAQSLVVQKCFADGCLAVGPLSGAQRDELRGGEEVKVRAVLPGLTQAADIPLSLNGLAAALDSLK